MRKLLALIRDEVKLREVFVFGGLAIASGGVALVHVPSALIVVGTVVLLLGIRR